TASGERSCHSSLVVIGVPVRSSVSVATPKRMVARYCLGRAVRYSAKRVDGPRQSRSSPDAKGSSVPVCPILRSPRARRARATTSCEVGPVGLSTGRTPLRSVIGGRRVLVGILTLGWKSLAQELLDSRRFIEHAVVPEVQFRHPPHVQAAAELRSDEGRGTVESRLHLRLLRLITQCGE